MHRKGWENTWEGPEGPAWLASGLRLPMLWVEEPVWPPPQVACPSAASPTELPYFRLRTLNPRSVFPPSGPQILGVALPDPVQPVQALLP